VLLDRERSSPPPKARRAAPQLLGRSAQQISTHWLRHTTLTWVERNFGYAVARAYAGHTGTTDGGTTSTYIRADLHEIAVALATLTGQDHPLGFAITPPPPARRDQR
jgi:hypothetical protein